MNADTLIREAERAAMAYSPGQSNSDKAIRLQVYAGRLEAHLRQAMHVVPMSQHERAVYLIKQAKEYCESIDCADFSCVTDKLDEAIVECSDVYASDPADTLAAVEEMRRAA
jgi:hypothetical protein